MIVLYSGEVGIYLQTAEELKASGIDGKCIAVKNNVGVLGERGLLTREPRGATCIAHTEVQALILSGGSYAKIVENFHRSEINSNIRFTEKLEFMKGINFVVIEKLVQ